MFAKRWTAIGLETDPADRAKAEFAIVEMYRVVGLLPPKKIVWCGSPLSQGLTRAIILDKKLIAGIGESVRDSVWASVGASVRASVWASVRDSVRDSVGASVRDSVRDSVWASVGASVRDSVWASVRDSVRDSVRASVRDSVRDSVGASVRDSVYGQHDAGWLAFYSFFRDVLGLVNQTEKLSGLFALCQSAGWALPHANICWISERHNILMRDERGQLHSITGPACAYPDGWAIYAVHGVRVPQFVVERPQDISMKHITDEKNTEVRRVMIERYGEDRYITDSGMKAVAHDENFGTLYFENLQAGRPICKVLVINRSPEPDGTFKTYWLPVNPQHYNGDAGKVPQAAVASTWRTTPGGKVLLYKDYRDYRPVVET
jgi:hypothetical protein